jgi:tRNA pseudouridine38-40 synthase
MYPMSADPQRSAESRVFVAPPAAGFTRVRMRLAYDGSGFRGMAENTGVETVAGTLRVALERAVGHPLTLSMAGRTDAAVHAWGQVISFDVNTEFLASGRAAPQTLARSMNRLFAPSIVVRHASIAPDDFDARFSARSRSYRYTVLNRPVPDPFVAATSWWVPEDLDLAVLRLGCDALFGLHDFSSFCRRPTTDEFTLVRRVFDAAWVVQGDGILRFDIEASSYCHQMVRSIVGTLVDMGRGRRAPGEMVGIIRARDRSVTGSIAPPQGLCLWDVKY